MGKLRYFTEVTIFNVFNHWQETGFSRTTTGGSAAGLSDPKGGLVVAPWTNGQGWGTRSYNNFTGGRVVKLSAGFKW